MAENETEAPSSEPKGRGGRKASTKEPAKLSNGQPARAAEANTVASGAYTPEDVLLAAGPNADKPGEHVAEQSALVMGAVVNQPENDFGDTVVDVQTEPVEGSDTLVRVTEDVVQEFTALGARRPSTRLIATKGQVLTKDQVKALGASN
jgi:hypothetical protein